MTKLSESMKTWLLRAYLCTSLSERGEVFFLPWSFGHSETAKALESRGLIAKSSRGGRLRYLNIKGREAAAAILAEREALAAAMSAVAETEGESDGE